MAETTEQYRNRINQLKTDIENEPYIKKMRENIAEGISETGNRQADIEVRQDKLEDDFVAVQQDARSNTPSGAELAVAAGSYNTLGERLDAEQNEVNAQLAHTDDLANGFFQKILPNATKINLYGTSITAGVGATGQHVPENNPIIFNNGTDVYRESDYVSPSWANYFRDYITDNYPNISFRNKGIGGLSARYVNTGTNKQALFEDNEDIAFVMLGMNDRGLGDFETNIREILTYVNERSNYMIVMVEQPVLNDNPSTNVEMRTINDTIIRICEEEGYFYISHYLEFLEYCQTSNMPLSSLVQTIGSHPVDNGHLLMWTNIQKRLKFTDEQSQFFSIEHTNNFEMLPMNFAASSVPITDYPKGVSYCVMQSLPEFGLPGNLGGVIHTYRMYDEPGNYSYNYREFFEYGTNKSFIQNAKNDGTWGPWSALNETKIHTISASFPSIPGKSVNGQSVSASTQVGVTFDPSKFAYIVSPKSVLDTNLFFSYSFSGGVLYLRLFNASDIAITPGTLEFDLTVIRK